MQIFELIVDIVDILHFPEWPKHMVQEHSVRYVATPTVYKSIIIRNTSLDQLTIIHHNMQPFIVLPPRSLSDSVNQS